MATVYATRADSTHPIPAPGDRVGNWLTVVQAMHRSSRYDTLLVEDARRSSRVVAKALRPDVNHPDRARLRLEREAVLTMSIAHPNIVRGIDWSDDPAYVLLEHLNGVTLRDLLRDRIRLRADEAAQMGIDVLEALAELHHRSIVHADIKPANIMVLGGESQMRFVVVDFDLARRVGEPVRGVGTHLFRAPEHAGNSIASPSADLWGVGILLYRALTGELPFAARSDPAQVHVARPVQDRVSDIPTAMARIVDDLIMHDPARRRSASRVADSLREVRTSITCSR